MEGPPGDFKQMLSVSDSISIRRGEDQPQFDLKGINSEMRLLRKPDGTKQVTVDYSFYWTNSHCMMLISQHVAES